MARDLVGVAVRLIYQFITMRRRMIRVGVPTYGHLLAQNSPKTAER